MGLASDYAELLEPHKDMTKLSTPLKRLLTTYGELKIFLYMNWEICAPKK
jgi:hypothetical protein